MKRWFFLSLALALGLALDGGPSLGQIVERERDVTITGPRGRSVERSIVSERGPRGLIDRQVTIQRPGGTFQSSAHVVRPPVHVNPGPMVRGGGFVPPGRPGGFGPRPNVFIN